jgi:sarcosine oxidase
MFRTIIVGGGLIGSAAARHLSAADEGVLVVAPPEPERRAEHQGVFASHYDEGRLTRIVDSHPAWAATAAASIGRYAEIERLSGMTVFEPSGFLGLYRVSDDTRAAQSEIAAPLGARHEMLNRTMLAERFPMMTIGPDLVGLVERETAGHISPRRMVRAQLAIAERQGAVIERDHAVRVSPGPAGVQVETASGTVFEAERALVSAGGFTGACGLTPRAPAMTVFGRTVVLFEIDEGMAKSLAGMPTVVDAAFGSYFLPPIRYPDGKLYVKIGVGTEADPRFTTLTDLQAWFKSEGSEENRRSFTAYLTGLIPTLEQSPRTFTDTCAVTATRTGLPYIDFLDEDRRLAVAVGGNGKGAKGSDEWGRAAALLMRDAEWDVAVDRDALKVRFA